MTPGILGARDGWDCVAANDALAHLNDLFTSRRFAVSVRKHVREFNSCKCFSDSLVLFFYSQFLCRHTNLKLLNIPTIFAQGERYS